MISLLARLAARVKASLKPSLMPGSNDQVVQAIDTINIGVTGDLIYRIPSAKIKELAYLRSNAPELIYWDLDWYKNDAGKGVRVSYSNNIADSEALAQRFIGESVIGFDMEWKPRYKKGETHEGIKNNISLIQMARDGEVGLFHIAQHKGSMVSELFAPSLLKVIRNSGMIKTGVNIYGADARQLRHYAGIEGKGFFELSHLHHQLIDHNAGMKNNHIQRKKNLHGLAKQLEMHLGFRLRKGAVRTSDWTKPLTAEMRQYAAADAYAGLVLFHTMNAKRLTLNPVPPLPQFAEHHKICVPKAKIASEVTCAVEAPVTAERENKKERVAGEAITVVNEEFEPANDAPNSDQGRPRLRIPPPLDVALESLKTAPQHLQSFVISKKISGLHQTAQSLYHEPEGPHSDNKKRREEDPDIHTTSYKRQKQKAAIQP